MKVLEAQPDNSVTIAAIGFPMNIRNLLRNNPDLFKQKVKAIYFMNGMYNFGCAEGFLLGNTKDCFGAVKEVQELIPHTTKQYFQRNGHDMCMAGDFFNDKCSDSTNPVRQAYVDWMDHSKFIGRNCWPARSSWDPLTVYVAVVGTDEAQMWEEQGTDVINALGHEKWDKSQTSNNESNLKFTSDDKK